MKQHVKLMIPGPVEVGPEVLEVMGRPLVAHYEAEFVAIHAATIQMAREVFRTEGDLFVMVGSGTAGLEACLGGMAGNGGRMLIPSNGRFAGLMSRIARSYSDQVEVVEFPEKEPIPAEALDRLLAERGDVRCVAMIHCETHSGLLNRVQDYGEVCRAHGAFLMVDAISSLTGTRLDMDAWKVDLCVTASQKGLSAPPGLTLVAVNPRCWPVLDQRADGPGFYLNLGNWRKRLAESGRWLPTLSTLAVNNFLALRKALELALEEGLEARFARHQRISQLVRQGVRSLGLEPYVPDEVASPTVTAVLLPEGFKPQDARDYIRQEHRIMIGGSAAAGGDRAIRIGHMGSQATVENVVSVLVAVEDYLRHAGLKIPPGQALAGVDPELLH
jgi:alanine-glyoxylate transaminase/serine-glyoxylate transaminase/serine-pyruvate transaminase